MKHWLWFLILIASPLFAAPQVVVSIKPVQDLTLAVMEGAGSPSLLVPPGASPHSYSLAPSQAKALYEADLIVWIGPGLETFLTQPLSQRKKGSTLLTLIEMPGMTLYPTRGGEAHEHGPTDPHLWLDPMNLMHYATTLAETLSKLDPEHAGLYAANSERVIADLKALDQSLANTLKPVEKTPLMVFHDAYQYFEKRYHLDIIGTVVIRPDTMPSVSRVLEIQQRLKSEQVRCIFSEPQFKPAIVERLVADTGIGYGVLDPLGSPTPIGLPGIESLFNHLSKSIVDCVDATPKKM